MAIPPSTITETAGIGAFAMAAAPARKARRSIPIKAPGSKPTADVIEVRPKSKNLDVIRDAANVNRRSYPFLEVDRDGLKGKFLDYPAREDVPENIREQLIVELYSK